MRPLLWLVMLLGACTRANSGYETAPPDASLPVATSPRRDLGVAASDAAVPADLAETDEENPPDLAMSLAQPPQDLAAHTETEPQTQPCDGPEDCDDEDKCCASGPGGVCMRDDCPRESRLCHDDGDCKGNARCCPHDGGPRCHKGDHC